MKPEEPRAASSVPPATNAGWLAAWLERGRKAGLFVLIVALCACLGLLISIPLWLFATRQSAAYTVFTLALIGAGLVLFALRTALRRRRLPQDAGRPARSLVARSLSVVMTVSAFAGLYAVAVLFVRRLWFLGALAAAVSALLLWLLGAARKAARKAAENAQQKSRKAPTIRAENSGR